MTPEQLEEIQARADAATEGPWFHVKSLDHIFGGINTSGVDTDPHDGSTAYVVDHHRCLDAQDADFIAHAREDVPALIDFVKEQRLIVGLVDMWHRQSKDLFQEVRRLTALVEQQRETIRLQEREIAELKALELSGVHPRIAQILDDYEELLTEHNNNWNEETK